MLYIPIEQITESDLQVLISEGRREDAQLEFKSTLPSGNDEGKKEFLKDVTAMANSQGGDIIYGIAEDRNTAEDAGRAKEIVGVTGVSADATKLWMSELLNSSVEERLIGIQIREIDLSSGGFALVLRVAKSWSAPHVVRHRNHWRFYARNSAGVYAMSVSDLRNAFLLTDTLGQRLEAFRERRFGEITENNPSLAVNRDWSDHKPSSTEDGRESALVIHIQPFDSIKPGYVVDIAPELRSEVDILRSCGDPYGDPNIRLNFDGILATHDTNYVQVYRSSATEEVDFNELSSELDGNRFDVECIGATELDRAIFKGVGRRLSLLKRLGVNSPVTISVSLLNVRGCKLLLRYPVYVGDTPSHEGFRLSHHSIDRQNLLLTGLLVENLQEFSLEEVRDDRGRSQYGWLAVQALLRPYCDSIWNAFGLPRSEYFDLDGKWVARISRSPYE